ncbi:DUF5675 family protein [Tellurirhabdus bombi]|uniref:DUF5675 family protein n=1 Tax=Tellurirhabdus bombi TaxID=2907205 RepID=UPI001F45F81E|nr:DUF5675 family protein [Tellurirhabdus bombi]
MNLKLPREVEPSATLGRLWVDGVFECHTLEDVSRGLRQTMPLSEIKELKVYGKTAIPLGTYQVALTYSNRFKRILPLLIDVPGFSGVRIHPGNTVEDTEGCILVGTGRSGNSITESRKAFAALMKKLTAVSGKEKIYITIC